MARPTYQPTQKERDQVKLLVGLGTPQEKIAKIIGIAENTLRKHFADELETGLANMNAQVAASLYKTATQGKGHGAVTAAIFWLKTQAGWKEKQTLEHTGKDGGPIKTDSTVRLDALDDQQLRALVGIADALAEKPEESGA